MGPVSGKYTIASPAWRQSSCFTSSTTPTTVNEMFAADSGLTRLRPAPARWPGQSFSAADRLMITLLFGVTASAS